MPSRTRRFRAPVRKQGPNFYVAVPAEVSAAFASRAENGRVRVQGTLEGVQIRGNLVPRGGGHWLFLHAGMRAAAGVGGGDEVELALRAYPWSEVPIASDVRGALEKAGVLSSFEAVSPSRRHELQRWADVAATAAERGKRVAALVAQVRGDTEPRKKVQAARRARPLWICPECGHRFVNRNQYHSCRRYTIDQTFAASTPEMRRLFEVVRRRIESLGPVHVQAYRDKVAFLVRVRFAGVMPKKRWLDLGFWLPRRIDSPRLHKVETLTPTDHVHLLRLTDPGELDDEVMGWLAEAYAVGEQKHLA